MTTQCPTCKGHGYIEWFAGPNRHTEVCEDCDGDGEIENKDGELGEETKTDEN